MSLQRQNMLMFKSSDSNYSGTPMGKKHQSHKRQQESTFMRSQFDHKSDEDSYSFSFSSEKSDKDSVEKSYFPKFNGEMEAQDFVVEGE